MSWFSKFFQTKEEPVEEFIEIPVSELPPPPAPAKTTRSVPRRVEHSDGEDDGAREISEAILNEEMEMPGFQNVVGGLRGGQSMSDADIARAKLREAFTPSHPVSDIRMFAGREELLQTLIRTIEYQQLHVVVYGDRGAGKTSMLHILSKLAAAARYTVCYTTCGANTGFSDFMRAAAANIPLLFHKDYEPTDKEIERGDTLANIFPDGEVSVGDATDIFAKLRDTRVLIILDEFDRAASTEFRQQIAELVKNLSDRSIAVQLVIAGVAASLNDLIAHIPSIRRNIAGIPVEPMTDGEIKALVYNGENASGLTFGTRSANLITKLANGSPYLANLLGQHAGLAATERDATTVMAKDISLARKRALVEIERRLSGPMFKVVERAIAAGHLDALGALAGSSMKNSGRIPDADMPKDNDFVANIIVPIDDDIDPAWTFVEEGAVPYVWLVSR